MVEKCTYSAFIKCPVLLLKMQIMYSNNIGPCLALGKRTSQAEIFLFLLDRRPIPGDGNAQQMLNRSQVFFAQKLQFVTYHDNHDGDGDAGRDRADRGVCAEGVGVPKVGHLTLRNNCETCKKQIFGKIFNLCFKFAEDDSAAAFL